MEFVCYVVVVRDKASSFEIRLLIVYTVFLFKSGPKKALEKNDVNLFVKSSLGKDSEFHLNGSFI